MLAKNSDAEQAAADELPPAATRITLPARTIFFRSISSPIMNSMKIRPSSEITEIDSCDCHQTEAEWTDHEAGDKIGEDQRLTEEMGRQTEHPGEQDAQRDVANQFVHALGRR